MSDIDERAGKIMMNYMNLMPEYYKQSDENRVFPVFAIKHIAYLQLTIEKLEARVLELETSRHCEITAPESASIVASSILSPS